MNDMPPRLISTSVRPWTDDQVASLNDFQRADFLHPFTCPRRGDGQHERTSDLGVLVATPAGWTCPSCDYSQNWAHGFMADRSWEVARPMSLGLDDV